MSNQYADAINAALGIAPTPPAPKEMAPQLNSAARKPTVIRSNDVGRVYSETYRGFLFVVREFGCVHIGGHPAVNAGYWTPYFTDEELLLEKERGNIEGRAQSIRNAIDRAIAGTPIWLGPWYARGLTI